MSGEEAAAAAHVTPDLARKGGERMQEQLRITQMKRQPQQQQQPRSHRSRIQAVAQALKDVNNSSTSKHNTCCNN